MAYISQNPNGITTAANSQSVVLASDQTEIPISTSTDKSISGSLTTTDSDIIISSNGTGTVIAEITGTWVGTIIFEGSNNSFSTYQAITSIYLGGIATNASTTTINGFFSIVCAGFAKVRCRMNPYTSGTANVLMNASSQERIIVPLQGNPDNNQTLSKQGAAGTVPWPTILTSSTTALAAGLKATMTAYGYQRMTLEPRIEFVDPFDGVVIDTTNNWTQSGTVTLSSSSVAIGNITTLNTVNSLTSKPSFTPLGISFQVLAFTASFETNPLSTTNVNRFYGFGTHTSTPTISQPVTEGCGFEWDSINGKLWLAVYQNGTRSASSVDLSAYVTSTNTRYALLYRSDLVIVYITTTEIPVGSISFVTPFTQTLPVKLQTIIGASAPSTTPLNKIGGVTVGDTGGNATQLSDGTFPFRKATIDTTGALKIASSGLPTSLGQTGMSSSLPVTISSDQSTVPINDINTTLLRRIIKIMETLSIVDSAQRQRIALDTINASATLANVTTVGTVTTVSTLTTLANGQTAHSSASSGSPVRIGGRVVPTTIATVDLTLAAGDASDAGITTGQQLSIKPFGTAELDIAVAVTPTVTSTSVQGLVAASGTASVRNYITQLTVASDTLGAAGNMFILDNQGAIGTSVTIATPGVFTSTAHDLKIGDTIIFTVIGTITGITINTLYYITATTFAATTFTIATSPGGTAIAITGSTSAFTFYRVFQLIRMQTTALASPIIISPPNPLRGIANANLNVYFPVSLTSGTIYINVIGYRGF